ncbi:MAG: hypothetical protein U5P10_09655 [Spirochaetia bacterium]|nr:hypothetical protein [Spirochaetia bacterium]
MQKLGSITIIITLVISTSCTTAPSAQGMTDPTQQQQSEQSTTVSSEEATQEASQFLSGHPYSDERIADALDDLPDSCIGEDGLFELVNPEYYFTDSWYKGYAGMFTQEDLNGKTIGGYEVNPPMQIFGSWSADGQEYFERVEDEDRGVIPRVTLYRTRLDWLRPEFRNYYEETPYRELDTEYREMITGDDSLTVDQQLELIIKNHMGYIRNMEIGDLAMQNATELTKEQAEELFSEFYGEDTFSTSPFTYYVGNPVDEVRSFERVFRYDDNIFISYDGELVDDSMGEEFVEQIVSSFEILKHRLPVIYDDILAPGDDHYWRINLVYSSRNWAAVTQYYPATNNPPRISFFPRTLDILESYQGEEIAEITMATLFHELIHVSVKSELIKDFQGADSTFNRIIDAYNEDSEKSELLTYSSDQFLGEILNNSYSGYNNAGIHSFYGYVDNTDFSDAWVGKDPMDYYVRIIDNRLGQ